ncbi:hypothetical protein Tco_0768200 [Tanacetum coccineum]
MSNEFQLVDHVMIPLSNKRIFHLRTKGKRPRLPTPTPSDSGSFELPPTNVNQGTSANQGVQNDPERYNADIRATNILLQGFPKDIYTLINHYTDVKDIWDNVKMLLECSKLIKETLNSKLVNNMLPEWGRFVTAVKLNKGLKDSNYDQLYAYQKQHEAHANENKLMLD